VILPLVCWQSPERSVPHVHHLDAVAVFDACFVPAAELSARAGVAVMAMASRAVAIPADACPRNFGAFTVYLSGLDGGGGRSGWQRPGRPVERRAAVVSPPSSPGGAAAGGRAPEGSPERVDGNVAPRLMRRRILRRFLNSSSAVPFAGACHVAPEEPASAADVPPAEALSPAGARALARTPPVRTPATAGRQKVIVVNVN